MKPDFANTGLPVVDALTPLSSAFGAANTVILEAAPGAGKTTLVPLFLLQSVIAADQKIIMLEPRRLAARAAAHRMASLLGETVGETVGYRVRLENKVGKKTRIEVVTEAILTRRLQSDPELAGVGLVIFDEFHERSLQTDLGLALTRQVQEVFRDDLKLLIMSATIDTDRLSRRLGDAPVIRSNGRQYPVETRFLPRKPAKRIEAVTAETVQQALREEAGDILVFLPGVGEIQRTVSLLEDTARIHSVLLTPLYGNLSLRDQEKAIQPDVEGRRKVVLATDIAETSLTIEGVRIVVDAGLSRAPVFDPGSGMSALVTRRVSRASADQRRGRAGRLGPGVCYRLWTAAEDRGLIDFTPPEIMTADLCGFVLELANWGADGAEELFWMDAPPPGPIAQGRELLQALGALDRDGRITPLGREILRLPLHPRLAGMMLKARALKVVPLAADIAALLSERDILRRDADFSNADIRARLEILTAARTRKGGGLAAQVLKVSEDLLRRMSEPGATGTGTASAGLLLAFAYPDRIGELRSGSQVQYRLSGGRGARLNENDRLTGEPYLVAAALDGKGRDARIDLAAPITAAEIEEFFAADIREERRVYWDDKKARVVAVTERRLGALILESRRLKSPLPDEIAHALLGAIRGKDLRSLPWDEESRAFVERVKFARLHDADGGWPDFSLSALEAGLEDWLLPYLAGLSSLADIQKLDLLEILKATLGYDKLARFEKFAPRAISVPSGSNIRLDYSTPEAPVLAVRLQEIFGLEEVPKLAEGQVTVSVHLLSPARRPVQITQDLASFWRTTYADVKKDLKGRYPKHYWPDDPMQAEPTARVKPRKNSS
ncbi:MAG: ATP-dependent helicase HrpB [Sneathiella sp.]|jgi:ATP-dependent helicase HrpB|uniref:ATP-dependent helicase HrpB n=1 Tax=Sneathiella sp. TaxID=1964365 RepID=UPI000C36A813|nr:ATP-dependent helicase HrpB [Sneathiella sp.]MAL80521.1 ATP-dependent helicase HrpB [Sneathiella sp.]